MTDVIYTAFFVDYPQQLLDQVPVMLQGSDVQMFAHHVTKEFRPTHGLKNLQIGRKWTLTLYAQIVTENIQAVLLKVDNSVNISKNKYPHITIATCNGVSPRESNVAIENAFKNDFITYFEKPILIIATEGYFDGAKVHTS